MTLIALGGKVYLIEPSHLIERVIWRGKKRIIYIKRTSLIIKQQIKMLDGRKLACLDWV